MNDYNIQPVSITCYGLTVKRGNQGADRMGKTIGVGVIGMGWMGMLHSHSYRNIPETFEDSDVQPRMVICADDVEARARKGQKLFGFEQVTTDWRQVIANPDVQAISITTPNSLHVEIVEAAAKAGKHIMCE